MSRAKPADPTDLRPAAQPGRGPLHRRAACPKPRVYVDRRRRPRTPSPPAATPKHAAIAVTTGLLEKMNRVELEGVLAHELSHIKNYDILVSTLAVTMVGRHRPDRRTSASASSGGAAAGANDNDRDGGGPMPILAIVGFVLLILVADHRQGHAARDQPAARGAGRRLRRRDDPLPAGADLRAREAAGRPDGRPLGVGATAHLWIEQPIARTEEEGRMSRINRLFDTHPPLEERIAALREL